MEKYEIMEEIGRGSYGVVWRAFDKHTCEIVAIKKLLEKYESSDECMNLIEVKALLMNNNHPNIIKLKDIIKENNTLYLIFEYMECSLYDRIVSTSFSETMVRNMCFQIFQGLAYMHRNGFFHRDLKPENLLVYEDLIKIGDLGQAREINSQQPFDYNVSTELYRAPEVFLRSPTYDSAIDMWAMGVIMAELFTNKSLFGSYETLGVIYNICSVLGTPTKTTWLGGLELARDIYYEFPQLPGVGFSSLLPDASSEAINLISTLFSWDPCCRPTAEEALQHPFFHGCYRVPPSINLKYMSIPQLEIRSLETCEDGFDEVDLEDLACFLPKNLFDF